MRSLITRALRRAQRQIRHVSPVRPDAADGLVGELYRQVEREFGMLAPAVSLHSPSPQLAAATWVLFRETLLVDGVVDRATKEAVATAVSRANECPYCIEAHSATLAALEHGDEVEPVAAWAVTGGPPPFPGEATPEIVGVAVTFQYLNRVVNVFLGDSPLPPEVPDGARPHARKFLGKMLRSGGGQQAGGSLELLPEAVLPPDASWASSSTNVSAAVARTYAAFEAAESVPGPVRDVVQTALSGWTGEPPGLSRAWVDEPLQTLPPELRPAGKLALLAALASYQIDDEVIAAYREETPGDQELVELVSWASMAAARRAGALLVSGAWTARAGEEAA